MIISGGEPYEIKEESLEDSVKDLRSQCCDKNNAKVMRLWRNDRSIASHREIGYLMLL